MKLSMHRMNTPVKTMVLSLLVTLVLNACDHADRKLTFNEHLATFIESGNYQVLHSKNEIPAYVMDSLHKMHDGKFRIGDISDQVDLSCCHMNGDNGYDKKFMFGYLSDSLSMIVYEEGGIGTHSVIEYFGFNPHKHRKFYAEKSIETEKELLVFLRREKQFR